MLDEISNFNLKKNWIWKLCNFYFYSNNFKPQNTINLFNWWNTEGKVQLKWWLLVITLYKDSVTKSLHQQNLLYLLIFFSNLCKTKLWKLSAVYNLKSSVTVDVQRNAGVIDFINAIFFCVVLYSSSLSLFLGNNSLVVELVKMLIF